MYKNLSFRGPGSFKAWQASFDYARAVEDATAPRVPAHRIPQSTVQGTPAWQMPEVELDGFFPRKGLPWYVAVLAFGSLALAAAVLVFGLVLLAGSASAARLFGQLFLCSGLIVTGLCCAGLLTILRTTAACALETVPRVELERFSALVRRKEPIAELPEPGCTYLELARYAAAFRRLVAIRQRAAG